MEDQSAPIPEEIASELDASPVISLNGHSRTSTGAISEGDAEFEVRMAVA